MTTKETYTKILNVQFKNRNHDVFAKIAKRQVRKAIEVLRTFK